MEAPLNMHPPFEERKFHLGEDTLPRASLRRAGRKGQDFHV